jgi:hypothetical protein
MNERTRAATYQEHVEYALIGGYALALHGIVRLTEDIDILVEPSQENTRRWVRRSRISRMRRRRSASGTTRSTRRSIRSGSTTS